MAPQPAPVVIASGGKKLGIDGEWSTLAVDIGTPPQTVNLLVSTQQPATWAVTTKGCEEKTDDSSCADSRGGLFDSGKSSTWFRKDLYQLNEAVNLGYGGNEQNGTYGFDTIALTGASGSPKVTLEHQVVAGIATHKFYVGSLGLAPQTVNFSNSGDSSPSFISSLKEQNLIPSLSYGYNAGATYKDKGGDASLTIGGFDSAKFKQNDLELAFASTPGRQLQAGLQSITYGDSKGEKPLLQEGLLALVDSTVPHLWLPKTSCDAFEEAFGLEWDPIANMYTVNDTSHDNLVDTNPTLTFSIASSQSAGKAVNITFPYAAFDLTAAPPIVKKEKKFFPLQRSPDDRSYTLGRAFLQEAYLITNFEKSTFSLSQAVHDDTPSNIVPIAANANGTSGATATGSPSKAKKGGFGTGAIAGVAIAIAVVGIIVASVAFWMLRRRRNAKKRNAEDVHQNYVPPMESKTAMTTTRTSLDGPEPSKKDPELSVVVEQANEPMTPPPIEMDGGLFAAGPSNAVELPDKRFSRGELSGPDFTRSELSSPGLEALRSELSTPEPVFLQNELPTPDPSAELPSPNLSAHDRVSPMTRPQSLRVDSTDSESGFTRDGMAAFGHRRYKSNEARPQSFRKDTDDSIESPVLGHTSTIMTDIDSPIFTSEANASPVATTGRNLPQVAKRPVHLRQDSDTWETRLESPTTEEGSAHPSRFNSTRDTERKGSETSEAVTISSLGDSPVVRKPVPTRPSVDFGRQAGIAEEDEKDKEKDEKAKQ